MRIEDICTHFGDDHGRYLGAAVPPIFQNSLFVEYEGKDQVTNADGGRYTYSRIANPTVEGAEAMIAALEGGETARCFSSGMGAVSAAMMKWVEKDCHVICVRHAYGPARNFLDWLGTKFGVQTSFVTGTDIEEMSACVSPQTRLIYLESPSTYVFSIQDLKAVAELAGRHGIRTVIDNTWATPVFQNPLSFGIDMVVHSCSKYLGGHSDIVGGVIIGRSADLRAMTETERAYLGNSMDPNTAWLLQRGLRTLHLRMDRHQENATRVASFLEQHPAVERVVYPGLPSYPQRELAQEQMRGASGVFSFSLRGDPQQTRAFIDRLTWFQKGPSWGGFESLIGGISLDDAGRRYTSFGSSGLRVSVGLENADTLIEDLDRSLAEVPL